MTSMSFSVTKETLVEDLRNKMGVLGGDIVGLHSSMKSLGHVDGGPETFIEALIEAVGGISKGTILMPCFNAPHDIVDLRTTPCCLGLIPETFRRYPGVLRSLNHTHSVAAIGKYSERIVATHRGRTPLGEDSPFHELAKLGGWIMHVGCDMTSSSIIHVAESIAKAPYLGIAFPRFDKDIMLIVSDTERFSCPPTENPGCSRNFMVVQRRLDELGYLRKGRIGLSDSFKVKGQDVLDVALCIFKEKGMSSLLCDSDACEVCPKKKSLLERLKR